MAAKQRVGGPVVKTLYTFYKTFGYKSVYYSLYLVVLYYFLFAGNVRKALKDYYKKLGVKFSYRDYFRHLFIYALATSDRFISKANPEIYTFINKERAKLLGSIQGGAILLSNHLGGWATASNYFQADEAKINVVMNESMIQNASAFESLIEKKNEKNVKIIDLSKGNIHTSVEIGNALLNNEAVAMMGDRAYNEKYEEALEFLGEKAYFNKNPFSIAYKTNKPIILLFVIFKDIRTYEMNFKKITLNKELNEEEAIQEGMQLYVNELTSILKQYPLQWFNFYNFWETK